MHLSPRWNPYSYWVALCFYFVMCYEKKLTNSEALIYLKQLITDLNATIYLTAIKKSQQRLSICSCLVEEKRKGVTENA